MIRHKMGTKPVREPTEEDMTWAAALFEEKMRFARYNSEYVVQLHTTNVEMADRLMACFGGGSYFVPGTKTIRWRASKDLMLGFLDKIQPFLSALAGQRLLALADLLEKKSAVPGEKLLREQIDFFARETARQEALARGEEA